VRLMWVLILLFSSSGYSTLSSDNGLLVPSLTNSPFTDIRGRSVPLYSYQPSSAVQLMPHASAADHSSAWLPSGHFRQVCIIYVVLWRTFFTDRKFVNRSHFLLSDVI